MCVSLKLVQTVNICSVYTLAKSGWDFLEGDGGCAPDSVTSSIKLQIVAQKT